MGFPVLEYLKNATKGPVPILIDDLVVDVLLREEPTYSYEITEHPVEEGLSVNDAKIRRPVTLSLDCVFMDMDKSALGIGQAALNETLSDDTWQQKKEKVFDLFYGIDRTKSEQPHENATKKKRGRLFEITTPFTTYKNMTLEEIRPDISVSTATSFFCTLIFREIRKVRSVIREVDDEDVPQRLKSKKKDKHKTKDTTKKPTENKGLDKLKGIFAKDQSWFDSLAEGAATIFA